MISHTSRTEARQSGKSSRHCIAQSPLECLARRNTRTKELQHPKTFVMGLSRSGLTHPLLRRRPKKPKNVTNKQQPRGNAMNKLRADRVPPTSHAMMVTNKHTANISFTCVVAMRSIIDVFTRQSLLKRTTQHSNKPLIKVMIWDATRANSNQIWVNRLVTTSRNRQRLHLMNNAANSQTNVAMRPPRAW